jgi:phage gp36-like protein
MSYSLLGYSISGSTNYFTLRNSVNQFWNGSAFEIYNAGNYLNYVIAAAESSPTIFTADFPAAITNAGTYNYDLRIRVTGTPLATDIPTWYDTLVFPGTGPTPPSGASGYYCSLQDLYNVYGEQNIIIYSDVQNTDPSAATLDLTRVQAALDDADSSIDMAMLDGRYSVPLAMGPIARDKMKDIAATFAGYWLYKSRGIREDSKDGDKYSKMVAEAERKLALIKSGFYKLDCQARWPSPNTPTAIKY